MRTMSLLRGEETLSTGSSWILELVLLNFKEKSELEIQISQQNRDHEVQTVAMMGIVQGMWSAEKKGNYSRILGNVYSY